MVLLITDFHHHPQDYERHIVGQALLVKKVQYRGTNPAVHRVCTEQHAFSYQPQHWNHLLINDNITGLFLFPRHYV